MTEINAGLEQADDDLSLFTLGSIILRSRRTILALALAGGVLGLSIGLLTPRLYISAATFIPQGAETNTASGLALAASQFGIRIPSSSNTWGPPVYVDLLRSRALLEPIALDTFAVAEKGGERVAIVDLLQVKPAEPALRTDRAVRALNKLISATEDKRLGAVDVAVATRWPSVSIQVAQRLLSGVNQFILQTRKSQAADERQFVEGQAADAERALREAEDRLQQFLQQNAIANSPQLEFQRDRLQREVTMQQQVYTSLVQSREDARIREVRDTPVITILEPPRLPVVGEARNSIQKAVLGVFAGGMLAILAAVLLEIARAVARAPSGPARDFLQLWEQATPRFLRRRAQG